MLVGITEIMETGHIALAESLCRIFCSDHSNSVILFTLENHASNLMHLKNLLPNLSIKTKKQDQSNIDFLTEIGLTEFNRLYVVTLNRYFADFSGWKPRGKLYMVIHNLDEWFGLSFWVNAARFFNDMKRYASFKLIVYLLKLYFLYPVYRKNILRTTAITGGAIVVLSESVRKEAEKLKVSLPVEVVPFSVYDPVCETQTTVTTGPLRICVPGILSQYRRNYLALLDMTEKHLTLLKEDFILDFLGGVQYDNFLNDSGPVFEKVKKMKKNGFKIIVHNIPFIPAVEYDAELSRADIILGNMNVVLTSHSEYGRTKETGIPFAMIKAARPGILPAEYPVPEELSSGTLRYNSYEELAKLLTLLIDDRMLVSDLQKKAIENSRLFRPDKIYRKLTGRI